MTPTATRLEERLSQRLSWFHNEWFFKWHFIGRDNATSIELFDGRTTHLGGITFSGTARDVYWEAITRGVRREVTEQMAWVDTEVRSYNPATAMKAIDECAGQIMSFCHVIRRAAIAKDRVLRGNGREFPEEHDAGRWDRIDDHTIRTEANALKAALPFTSRPSGFRARSLAIWNTNQGWLQMLGIAMAAIGVIAAIFTIR